MCSVVEDTLPSDSTRYLIVIIFSFLKWYILLVRINAHNNNIPIWNCCGITKPHQALVRATVSVRHPKIDNVIFWRLKRKKETAYIVLYIIYLAYLTQGIVYGVGNLYPQHENVSVMVPRILCWVLGGPGLRLEAWHGGVDGLQPLADAGVAQPQVLQ